MRGFCVCVFLAFRAKCGISCASEDRKPSGGETPPLREMPNELDAFRVPNPSLPLPVGEVSERSKDGEGNKAPGTLSVTFGDSSPKGGAKGQHTDRRRFFVAALLRMTDKWGPHEACFMGKRKNGSCGMQIHMLFAKKLLPF